MRSVISGEYGSVRSTKRKELASFGGGGTSSKGLQQKQRSILDLKGEVFLPQDALKLRMRVIESLVIRFRYRFCNCWDICMCLIFMVPVIFKRI